MAARKQATAAEAAAINHVYRKLADLLDALRDAQMTIHHPQLNALVNQQIDRALEDDTRLRNAILEYTGKPVEDPY